MSGFQYPEGMSQFIQEHVESLLSKRFGVPRREITSVGMITVSYKGKTEVIHWRNDSAPVPADKEEALDLRKDTNPTTSPTPPTTPSTSSSSSGASSPAGMKEPSTQEEEVVDPRPLVIAETPSPQVASPRDAGPQPVPPQAAVTPAAPKKSPEPEEKSMLQAPLSIPPPPTTPTTILRGLPPKTVSIIIITIYYLSVKFHSLSLKFDRWARFPTASYKNNLNSTWYLIL